MWMNDITLGLLSLTKKDFLDQFLNDIKVEELEYFKDLMRHIFVSDPDKRIKIDTLLKKLKKHKKVMEQNNKRKKNSL